uniref:Uncharacterized protein n=1 Tax=Romanomermis culicivorax TaxID=13658 RepID=A0A915KDK3_ROMCU
MYRFSLFAVFCFLTVAILKVSTLDYNRRLLDRYIRKLVDEKNGLRNSADLFDPAKLQIDVKRVDQLIKLLEMAGSGALTQKPIPALRDEIDSRLRTLPLRFGKR